MRGIHRTTTAFALGAALLAAACGDAAGPELSWGGPLPGVLQLESYGGVRPAVLNAAPATDVRWASTPPNIIYPPQAIVAPDTVQAGETFEVITYTLGENGCWTAGDQQVQIGDGIVELSPFDVHSGNTICTLILSLLPHREELTLTVPGEWVLRVWGRRARSGQPGFFVSVSAEKTIVVR